MGTNKVIIIEDRSSRKSEFLSTELKNELDKMNDVVTFIEGDNYNLLKSKLAGNDLSDFEAFSVIISHRSAFDHSLLDKIKVYCENKRKPLVFFSGGISASYYDESKIQFLTMNSKEFYSNNLISFLNKIKNEDEIEVPIIQYGNNWELNYLMASRNSIANYLHLNPDIQQITRYVIEHDIKLTGRILKILKDKYPNIENISLGIKENGATELKKIFESITEQINEKVKQL